MELRDLVALMTASLLGDRLRFQLVEKHAGIKYHERCVDIPSDAEIEACAKIAMRIWAIAGKVEQAA